MKTMAAGSLLNLVHVQLVLPVVQLSCTVELLEVYEHYYVVLTKFTTSSKFTFLDADTGEVSNF